jgi:hypothetical protein
LTRYAQAARLDARLDGFGAEFMGSTMSLPHSSASAAANGPSWSLWNADS